MRVELVGIDSDAGRKADETESKVDTVNRDGLEQRREVKNQPCGLS